MTSRRVRPARKIVTECAERSVSVIALSRHDAVPDGAPNGLVLGFGARPSTASTRHLDALIETLETIAARRVA